MDTDKFTATAQWDDIQGNVYNERFITPDDLVDFLIEQTRMKSPVLIYAHNLEWDFQVLCHWTRGTRLQYIEHLARNGSALTATFDYEGRPTSHRKIVIRDSFAIWPLSLRELGKAVGLPKLRTPRTYMPHIVNWADGSLIPPKDDDDDKEAPPCDEHGRDECLLCYDRRDAAILYRAMRLYVDECNTAGIAPALTRSAHAMRDFRTNYLPTALHQYTERQNLRALASRRGGRSQMLETGLVMTEDVPVKTVIVQLDVVNQYPSVMVRGDFPHAGMHHIIYHPRSERVREYTGFAWAQVAIPDLPLGPLVYRHENGRTDYPVGCTVQGCWTTDELAYGLDVGCEVIVLRLEGTPKYACVDPFSHYVQDKVAKRLQYKADGNPMQLAEKLSLNGLSGKFGMRWTEPLMHFSAAPASDVEAFLHEIPFVRDDKPSKHYPDYIMMPWSALIMARGRIVLHKYAMELIEHGAQLLCCDTDSWTVKIVESELANLRTGSKLGDWELKEDERYIAFRGAAPKEYALYADWRELSDGEPVKARAKGIGGLVSASERSRAIDHYLRTGDVHFQRPQKSRSVLRGAPMATFVPVHKTRHARVQYPVPPPLPLREFARRIRTEIKELEARRVWSSPAEPAEGPVLVNRVSA